MKTDLNIIKFANDPELWETFKMEQNENLESLIRIKTFIEKHLSENFINLIPNKKLLESIHGIMGFKHINGLQDKDTRFFIELVFTESKLFEVNIYEIEIKLKDIATNCKVVNKKELKEKFTNILFRIGYDYGFLQGMLRRIEIDLAFLNNDRNIIKVKESIYDVKKIFFENAKKIVKHYPMYYPMLFQFENFIKDEILIDRKNKDNFYNVKQTDFYQYITDLTNIDKRTVGQRFRDFKKKKLIPNINKKFLPMN